MLSSRNSMLELRCTPGRNNLRPGPTFKFYILKTDVPLNLIFGYPNVYFDSASEYNLSSVHERVYINNLTCELERILKAEFFDFDFYFLFAHNSMVTPSSLRIQRRNKILIWFGDESGHFPARLSDHYRVIFKSYITKEDGNIYLNPVGYINEFNRVTPGSVKKDIKVFFSGNLNSNRLGLYRMLLLRKGRFMLFFNLIPRRLSLKLLRKFKHRMKTNLGNHEFVFLFSHRWKSGLEYQKYQNYLVRSTFSLCPKGFYSSETFRHLESMNAGCIVISEKMPEVLIYRDHPFLIYNNLQELEEILRKIERSEFNEPDLIQRHQLYYQKFFTMSAIASRIAEICLTYKNVAGKVAS